MGCGLAYSYWIKSCHSQSSYLVSGMLLDTWSSLISLSPSQWNRNESFYRWESWDSSRVTFPRKITGGWISKPFCPDSRACALCIGECTHWRPSVAPLFVSLLFLGLWSQIVIPGPAVGFPWIVCPSLVQRPLWHCVFRSSKELLLQPVTISRNEKEKVLIEGSINSVRVSIAVKQVSSAQSPCLSRKPGISIWEIGVDGKPGSISLNVPRKWVK